MPSFPLGSDFVPLMGPDEFTAFDAYMALASPVHPDASWPSHAFSMPFMPQFSQPAEFSSFALGASGVPVYQAAIPSTNEGDVYPPPIDWFPQPSLDSASGSNITIPATPAAMTHDYRRLPGTEDEKLDVWLEISMASGLGRKTFQCKWQDCATVPFTGLCQAYTHVRKHLGQKKLFGCVACNTQFATRGAAKRHSLQMSFQCSVCEKVVKRRDYWLKHERECANKRRVL
ncbi:hypothetical protein JB92DRAFT_3112941 [Gautieria morchelliformis]|nr:hypothetical protein JB92DRAFT_3112941 [Gautieria morchelliformis]